MKRLCVILILFILMASIVIPVSAADNKTKDIKILSEDNIVWKDITKHSNGNSIKLPTTKSFTTSKGTKFIQVYYGSVISISEDTEIIMQQTPTKKELYYGYQKGNISIPWENYYKVENCDATKCRVVRGDFATRQVWIETITVEIANGITGLPEYNDLPKGVKI